LSSIVVTVGHRVLLDEGCSGCTYLRLLCCLQMLELLLTKKLSDRESLLRFLLLSCSISWLVRVLAIVIISSFHGLVMMDLRLVLKLLSRVRPLVRKHLLIFLVLRLLQIEHEFVKFSIRIIIVISTRNLFIDNRRIDASLDCFLLQQALLVLERAVRCWMALTLTEVALNGD
jgi:hypothetical protein